MPAPVDLQFKEHRNSIAVCAAATIVCLIAASDGVRAQAPAGATAEELIESARQVYRVPGLQAACPPGGPGEIVVCAPASDQYRVSSPTDDAIAEGDPVYDGLPRAPDVGNWPPCVPTIFTNFCERVYRPLPRPLLIDLSALPQALTPEEAALVFRAEEAAP